MTTDPDLHTATLSDGGRLCYRVVGRPGAGLPILLNRPLGGTMRLWGELLGELAREHQVIAFDPRGVGDSSALPLLHSTRDMAGDALQLLQQLRIERACIFGLSLGGMVASWLAIDAPERVERLVLASTLPEPSALSHRFKRHIWKFASSATRPGAEAEVALVNEVLSPHFRHAHPERVREIEAQVRAQLVGELEILEAVASWSSVAADDGQAEDESDDDERDQSPPSPIQAPQPAGSWSGIFFGNG